MSLTDLALPCLAGFFRGSEFILNCGFITVTTQIRDQDILGISFRNKIRGSDEYYLGIESSVRRLSAWA